MQYISKKHIKLPKRKKDSKKGDNGSVLVVGGSEHFIGAVALAGLAALHSGVDGAHIVAPDKVAWAINCLSADLVTIKVKGNYFSSKHAKKVINLSKTRNVLLIGNGIGIEKQTKQFVKDVVNNIKNPKVVDADGIKAISSADLENSIITPHKKELEIFMKNSKINQNILEIALNTKDLERKAKLIRKSFQLLGLKKKKKNFFENNNVILLKGKVDTIISKENIYFNKTGNAGMTKGGTGDVLAGLAAGFLAQNKSLLQSAINAAYFNGLIGDILLKKKKGFTYLASDMVEEIKRVLRN
jgi:NAD(P)H-hydrate epimerase|tara:strand:- start:382 stop:1278 length:897 start_codon:yes stop_codon:yes gene_type:complete